MKKMTPEKTKEKESRLQSGGMVAVLLVSVLLLIAAYPASADTRAHFDPSVRVMTRNLYVGADIFAVVNLPSPDLIPLAVAQTYAMIVQNDFAQRAEALAREIAEKNPDLIGCQEVVLLTRLRPADDPQAPPTIEQYDFLVLLLDALQTWGLDYEVAAVGLNADVTLPMLQAIDEGGNVHLDYVNYRDRDVILAKKGVTVKHAATHAFRTNFTVVFSETQSVVFQRGFVAVDATVRGKTYRFVNAHVEKEGLMASDGTVAQQAQVAELLQELAKENLPVLLVGDFNLIPERSGPQSHREGRFRRSVDAAHEWAAQKWEHVLPGRRPSKRGIGPHRAHRFYFRASAASRRRPAFSLPAHRAAHGR